MPAASPRISTSRARRPAFFPDITLGLVGGYQSSGLGHWLSAPNEIWSVGPSLMLTLFDGGRRQAITDQAHARLAENGARYRSVVLRACQQVEDDLALTHHLGDEAAREQDALDAAERTLRLSTSRYRDGVVSYLDVVTAQTTELDTRIAMIELDTRRQLAAVGLIAAPAVAASIPAALPVRAAGPASAPAQAT